MRSPFLVFSIVLAIVVAVVIVYPLVRVLLGLVVVDGAVTLEPLKDIFAVPDLGVLLLNTLVVVGASSLIALVVGAALAWLNERTDARMGSFTDSLPLITYLVPPIAGAIGWVLLLSPTAGLLNGLLRGIGITFGNPGSGPLNIFTWAGLIFVYTLYQVPYAFLSVSAGLRNTDSAMEEQSRVSGAGLAKTLWRVTIPSVRPALGGAVLLMLVQGFALFSVPVIIGTGAGIQVLAVRIVELLNFTYPPQMVEAIGMTLIMVLLVAVAWTAQNRILRSGRHGTVGGKGQRFEVIRLRGWRPVARAVFILYGLLAVVLPIAALILVTLSGFWSATIKWSTLTLSWFVQAIFGQPTTLQALGNSLMLGLVGATVGILISAIVSVLIARRRARWALAVDGAIKLPAVVSHIVIGVGVILAFAGQPLMLGGTVAILLLAYLIVYLSQGSVSTDAAVAQVGTDLAEASAVAGAGYGRTFFRVYLPLILPAMVAGWAYLFAHMAGDLTVTAILGSPSNITVGYLLLQTFHNGSFGQLAPIAVVLTIVSSVIVIAVITISNRWSRRQTRRSRVPIETTGVVTAAAAVGATTATETLATTGVNPRR
jgi:iron(III) transport system permease protein